MVPTESVGTDVCMSCTGGMKIEYLVLSVLSG
jgi:hypothetical protein